MKMQIVSIFDRAAKLYSRPAFVQSRAAAVRSFGDEVRTVRENNDLNKHPGDFELTLIGEFDDETGTLIPITPERICYGLDFVTLTN
jgi:hypothetical protein